ncbi:MAG: hypothetical protein QNJ71_09190, partial [Acidimicrobiia bacterium]|nr:hypothetical protein [Acidimicrobiia bacterium]
MTDTDAFDETVRLAIYVHFAESGRAPTRTYLAETTDSSPVDVGRSIGRLAEERHLALNDAGDIVMA